jgi:hypothetical protein
VITTSKLPVFSQLVLLYVAIIRSIYQQDIQLLLALRFNFQLAVYALCYHMLPADVIVEVMLQ